MKRVGCKISLIVKVCDLLSLKLEVPEKILKLINDYFPESIIKVDNGYDYKIIYKSVNNIKKLTCGKTIKPFRNSNYKIKLKDDYIMAHKPSEQDFLIIRHNKIIYFYSSNSYSDKEFIRLIRELIYRKLLEINYFPIHASCVVNTKGATLFIGGKNEGKSTSLLNSILCDKTNPLSNDITFVGKENGIWNAFGTSYDITFNSEVYNIFNNKEKFNTTEQINSKVKIRFTPKDFCEKFNTKWIWKAPIYEINFVKLNPQKHYFVNYNISKKEKLSLLNKSSNGHVFNFGDYLKINNCIPKYNFSELINDISMKIIGGNIFNRDNHSNETNFVDVDYSIVSRGTENYYGRGYNAITAINKSYRYLIDVDHGIKKIKLGSYTLKIHSKYSIYNIAFSRFQLITALMYEENHYIIKDGIFILGLGNVGFSCLMYFLDKKYKKIMIYVREINDRIYKLKKVVYNEFKVNLEFTTTFVDLNKYKTIVETTGDSNILEKMISLIDNKKVVIILSTLRDEKIKISPLIINRKNLVLIGGHEFNGVNNNTRQKIFDKLLNKNQNKNYLKQFINIYKYSPKILENIKNKKGNFIELFKY